MFKQLQINITLADALILIPKYQKMLKELLSNKEKLVELANTPLSENCSADILKKLPKKLGDPGKFLIPCSFSELKCQALADLGASINLMPLSVWKRLGLPELIPTRMTLELANRTVCTPAGIARDVFVPVGKFTFPADFVIVDYIADARIPLILGRPFLRTAHALIDVHGEELILRDGNERLILNMKHNTLIFSDKPQEESINMIDIYDVSYKDNLEDFFANKKITNNPESGNPTPISDPIVSSSSTLTSFEESDLIWEEFEAYLANDSFPPGSDDADFDLEGDLRLIEELLNNDPSSPLPLSHNPLSSSTTSSSPSLTPVETSDALLEEFADELALLEPFPLGIGDDDFDPEGDILLLEKLLNDDPSSPLPPKELNFEKLKMIKSSIDDFPPLDVLEEKSVTFSNPLFDSNDDFTSSDDESLSDEDVMEDVKIYSNPLFKFDDEYISSDVNPLFDEVLEDIECKDSYDSNLDESTFLVTPLSDSNEDECLTPVDEIEFLPHPDPSISIVSILKGFTNEPPLEENDDLFDLESKGNEWKKILYDAPIDDVIFDPGGDIDEINAFLYIDISTDIEDGYHDSEGDILYLESLLSNDTILTLPPKVFLDHDPRSLGDINDLKIMVKIFDPGIHENFYFLTYVSLPFEYRHYLSLTYVIRNFLPYFTNPVDSSLLYSSRNEDTIFDPGISAFHFSLEPVAFKCPMEVCSSTCFVPNITMI
ncbi:reverse transcriptase domain-containing protein [Tanacetum coccineum]